jgi:hypothetical protein
MDTTFTWIMVGVALFIVFLQPKVLTFISRRFSIGLFAIILALLYYAYASQFEFASASITVIVLFVIQGTFMLVLHFSNPGIITGENVNLAIRLWPYDQVFYPERRCQQTGLLAPARSKYVPEIRRQVARFSHFASFFSKPIGIGNHRCYLFLMLSCALSSIILTLQNFYFLRVRITAEENLGTGRLERFLGSITLLTTDEPLQFAMFLLLLTIAAVQTASLLVDCHSVSVNVMSNEGFGFDLIARASKGKARNPYDKGFVANWRECLAPPFH